MQPFLLWFYPQWIWVSSSSHHVDPGNLAGLEWAGLEQGDLGVDATWTTPGVVRAPDRQLVKGSCDHFSFFPEEGCGDRLLSLFQTFLEGLFLQSGCQLGNNEVTRGSGRNGV